MRKRNVHVQFWLDKKEAEAFNKKVKRSGLSREAYLRHLVNGLVPQDAPPPAYYDFMRELHRIGSNLNQIAQKAHVLGVIDERRYQTYVLHLIDGTAIPMVEDYDLPAEKGIVGHFSKAAPDEIFTVGDRLLGFAYILKSSIVYLETGDVIVR